jgi:hypothetical protein
MPSLNIEGRKVTVDDSFLKLSPEQQNETVDHIASSLRASGHLPAGQSQRQTVSQPAYDPMGNVTGGTEDVQAFEQSRSPIVAQSDDILKGAAGGVVRGAAGLVGAPALAADYLTRGSDYLAQKLTGQSDEDYRAQEQRRKESRMFPGALEAIKPEGIQHGIETVTGPAYLPTTRAGKLASAGAEFGVGGAIGRTSNLARNVIGYGVVPGLLSEGAGQVFEGGPMETPARVAGALAGGVGSAVAMRGGTAGNMVRAAVDGATPQQLEAAEQLFQRAAQAGTPISRAEAIQSVTNGATRIGDLQHTVEGMGGMKPFYAERPAQNETAARRAFDEIAPPNRDPSRIGPTIGETGERLVQDVRAAINTATRPMYDAAGQHLVPQQVHAAMMADPLFAETVQTIRNDPARNALVRGQSDRSINVYDAVAKELETRSQNVGQVLNPQHNQTISAVTGNLGGDVKNIAIAADRAATNGPSSYEAALATQARLRRDYLNPLLDGPIGKIAGRDTTTKKAVEALFPENPLPNSEREIGQAIGALASRSPRIARDLVRAHAEGVFNEATQRMASGGLNQSGGAKFAAVLRGNPQQAANLEASVRALPNGDTTWQGFNAFLENMEAQQFRQATGSRTAFKIPGVEDLKSGGIANNVAQVVGSGGIKLPQKIANAVQNWNVGRNLDELSRLLTDPAAAATFRQIATAPAGSNKAIGLTARLTALAIKGSADRPRVNIDTTNWRDGTGGSPR